MRERILAFAVGLMVADALAQTAPPAAAPAVTVLKAVRMFDGRSDSMVGNAVVIVVDRGAQGVFRNGPPKSLEVPSRVRRMEAKGSTMSRGRAAITVGGTKP